MAITYFEKERIFKLDTPGSSYVIGIVDKENFVGHVYYGKKLRDANISYLLRTGEGPFVPSENNRERVSFYDTFPMEYAGRKIPLPKERKQGEPFPVRRHQIDTNHHVNNSQYVQMALDVWEEMGTPSKIRELRVEYKKSAVYGDMIYPSMIEEQDNTTIVLGDEKERPYAIVQVRGEN